MSTSIIDRRPAPPSSGRFADKMDEEAPRSSLRLWASCLGLAAVYFVAGKLGLKLAFVHASASAVWPPAGISIAALMVMGYSVFPGIFLGAFLVNLTTMGTVWTSLGIALGNTLEATAGAWMIKRWAKGCNAFYDPQTFIKFASVVALSAMIASTVGVTSLALGHFADWHRYGLIWLIWWLGDTTGSLIVAPLIILWILRPRISWTRWQAVEASALFLALLLVCQVVFNGWQPTPYKNHPSSYLLWPILIWVALRFDPRETATALCLISGLGLYGTLHGLGPFSRESPNANLVVLQAFLAISTGAALVLAADVFRRREAEAALQQTQEQLEQHVAERTAALVAVNSSLRKVIKERQEIQQDVRRLAAIVEYSQDAIIGMDLEGVIQTWNPAAETLFGYSSKEVLGLPFTLLAPQDNQYRLQMEAIINKLKAGKGSQYEARRVRKDGTFLDVSVCVSPIKNAEGTVIGFSKIIRDIGVQKEMEAVLRQKTEQLTHTNAELSLFASAVSHELQEPVRKIVGFGEMIQTNGAPATTISEYVGRMKNAATRMQTLIEGLLSMSRVTTQLKPLESVSLDEILQDVLFDFKTHFEQAGAKIERDPLPAITADPMQIRQLFQNLISNAFKFRKKDEPLLIRITSRREENGFIEITVRDNGIGFEEQYASRIFRPFERLHRRGEYEGSGLGLAICERIALRHGGTITAKSEPGKGSAFIVTLPA